MKKEIKKAFGREVEAAWRQLPPYVQATEAQRQELDAVLLKIDCDTEKFEHVQSYGQAIMNDVTLFYRQCEDMRLQKAVVDNGLLAKTFNDIQSRMDLHDLGGQEIQRRYSEEYIPKARDKYLVSHDPEDQACVTRLENRQQDFADRQAVLRGARSALRNVWYRSGHATLEAQRKFTVLKKIALKKPASI